MKSHYNRTLTESQAARIGMNTAKVLYRREIERYNREELPKIRASYAKIFILVLAAEFGFGDKRIRRALKALAELTCEVHNLVVDGVFNDIYDKRLKERGLWEAYEEFANGRCKQIDGTDYYEPIKEESGETD